MKEAAALMDRKIAAVIDVNLYHFIGTKCSTVKEIEEPVSITIALPKILQNEKAVYSVLCTDAQGSIVEYPDLNDDVTTISIETTCFGPLAIVYK